MSGYEEKSVADVLLLSARGLLTGTVTRVLGDLSAFAQSDTLNFTNLETLRQSLTSAKVTTYRYRPSVGLVETVAPDGRSTTYEYDALGRLSLIRDNDGNILKTYEYNYRSNENN